MSKTAIAAHDPQVVLRHEIPCAECAGVRTVDGSSACTRCRGTGRIGNCTSCGGVGFFCSGDAHGGPRAHYWSCCRCGGKGWVGNCADCSGLSVVESTDGYAVCSTCRGHGHLYEEFYGEDPVRGALIVSVREAGRFFVLLGEAPVVFGRFPPPYTTVRLADELMTKVHFEIITSASARTHDVHDFGRFALMINGHFLGGTADRVRRPGHGPSSEGDRCQLAFGDVLAFGQYSMEYIALRNPRRQSASADMEGRPAGGPGH